MADEDAPKEQPKSDQPKQEEPQVPALPKIRRKDGAPRVTGLPVIRGNRYETVPFDPADLEFEVDVDTMVAALASGSFEEAPANRVRLKAPVTGGDKNA